MEVMESKVPSGFGRPDFNGLERMLFRFFQLENYCYSKWFGFRYRDRVKLGKNCSIHPHTFVHRGTGMVEMGDGVILERGLHKIFFNLEPNSKVVIGDHTWFLTFDGQTIFSCKSGAEISLGKDCWLAGGHFAAAKKITIGEHTLIGRGCLVLDSDLHQMDNESPVQCAPVTIGSHCWLPNNITILKGVTIGDHCVIGNNSLVTDDIPDHSFAAGTPARVIRKIGERDRVP